MHDRHILAGSGGFTYIDGNVLETRFGPILRYGLSLTQKERPKICYIGTANGDSDRGIVSFYGACINESVEASHVQLFSIPNVEDVEAHLLSQDIIWVQGGSVVNLLAVWRAHGLDIIMKRAWEKGVVLSGISAGSICWHQGGTTDSFGREQRFVLDGLAFLPYGNSVHYDSEKCRRPLLHQMVSEGLFSEAYATDDGVSIHYVNQRFYKAVADQPEKYAYHIYLQGENVVENQLQTEFLD